MCVSRRYTLAPFGALGAQMLTGTSLYGERDAVHSEREKERVRARMCVRETERIGSGQAWDGK